jgi:hypothetical protein
VSRPAAFLAKVVLLSPSGSVTVAMYCVYPLCGEETTLAPHGKLPTSDIPLGHRRGQTKRPRQKGAWHAAVQTRPNSIQGPETHRKSVNWGHQEKPY